MTQKDETPFNTFGNYKLVDGAAEAQTDYMRRCGALFVNSGGTLGNQGAPAARKEEGPVILTQEAYGKMLTEMEEAISQIAILNRRLKVTGDIHAALQHRFNNLVEVNKTLGNRLRAGADRVQNALRIPDDPVTTPGYNKVLRVAAGMFGFKIREPVPAQPLTLYDDDEPAP